MTKILDVYFYETIVGQLIQDNQGEMNFIYSAHWLTAPHATSISCSLPLQKNVFKRKECRPFFGGILPEETNRKIIAKNLGISANNDFSLLEKIGGECAGALSFIPHDEKISFKENEYHEVKENELANILRELPSRPLLAGEQGVRLSLAGAQDKLALYIKDNRIFIPLNNSPSTHILKPDFSPYDGVIFNEAFCLTLANQIGLAVAEAEVKKIEDIYYLLVKRYDRISTPDSKKIIRVHQEDFCQALGILSTNKYQNEGGPSLKQCFDLIRKQSSAPVLDLEKMMNAVIFNFLIGNCDAHGKNFSLIYLDQLQLAPLYDLICTLYYKELSQKMAMKLGGEYQISHVRMIHFDKLAEEIGFAKPEVRRRVKQLAESILSVIQIVEKPYSVQEQVADLIVKKCVDFIKQAQKL